MVKVVDFRKFLARRHGTSRFRSSFEPLSINIPLALLQRNSEN
jgi:hypothetical protein